MKERENEWRNPALTGASDLVSSLTIIEGMNTNERRRKKIA